jgi:uncharacterized YccA/Bax inhibitor family protein
VVKSSNPVLARIGAASRQPRLQGQGYGAPGQGYGYGSPAGVEPKLAPPGVADVMTIDDVVMKTVGLIGTTALAGAATFALVPDSLLGAAWISGAMIGLVLGLVISFAQLANPVLIITYAVVEGVFLGAVSKFYESLYNGIVLQAVIATLGTFLAMAVMYRAKIIRATPKFMKIVIGFAIGLTIVMVVNLVVTLFTSSPTVLRDGGPIAILFSLVCIGVAALMFVINFKQIEDGVAVGLPRKYGWLGAFGILVELVWMYLEFLRLISYFSED